VKLSAHTSRNALFDIMPLTFALSFFSLDFEGEPGTGFDLILSAGGWLDNSSIPGSANKVHIAAENTKTERQFALLRSRAAKTARTAASPTKNDKESTAITLPCLLGGTHAPAILTIPTQPAG